MNDSERGMDVVNYIRILKHKLPAYSNRGQRLSLAYVLDAIDSSFDEWIDSVNSNSALKIKNK